MNGFFFVWSERLEKLMLTFVSMTVGEKCRGVAGWRLKPAEGVYGRLALDPIAALQGDKKARLQTGGGFPLL